MREDQRTGGTVMEWLVVAVFLVFIGGLAVVTTGAAKYAYKSLHNNPSNGRANRAAEPRR